jgi:hypothetical protein
MAGPALRFDAAENDSSAHVLTGPAAAEVIRATVNNRVDNELRGASVANHCRRREERSRAVFPLSSIAARTVAPAAATPSSLSGGSPGSLRDGDLFAA